MNSFLHRIAAEYYHHHKNDLSSFTFVFPNRRAGLFFQKYLYEIADVPLFSPAIITIESCFTESSGLQLADKLSMLFRLYHIYRSMSQSEESFDTFAFWGETLLADFNEIDKYRVDARQLFTNITELKEIDQVFNVFTEQQIEAIRQFWQHFEPIAKSKSQEHFIATWEILYPIYKQFRQELLSEHTGYEGMIFREITDRLKNKENISWFENRKFVFIGFNALNPCEKELMKELKKREQADFYWDYEANELRDTDNPASFFYKENTLFFKSTYEIPAQTEKLEDKQVELIEIPSAIGQAKQIYQVLQHLYPDSGEQSYLKTAIVIPDENLLLPILYSIPENITKINITMGYPLQLTPVAGLIDHVFELQKRKRTVGEETMFYHLTVSNILNHQFIQLICGDIIKSINDEMLRKNLIYVDVKTLQRNSLLSLIFNPDVDSDSLPDYLLSIIKLLYTAWNKIKEKPSDYQLESGFLYQYYITINRISGILKTQAFDVRMQMETLIRLIKQLTLGISIPFVGEPLDGLQIIGTLETRGLDFENIIISSFNEGIYPKKSFSSSFIPYHLRKGFNLPTYEHQDAITSYNFYRLIHRAKRIFLLYDSRTDNGNTGEVSRFYQQLKYHYNLNINKKKVAYDVSIKAADIIQVEKDTTIQNKLKLYFETTNSDTALSLSASSINTYIRCPLQFYFTYIEQIEPVDEVSERMETNIFGSIFHEVIASLYKPYTGRIITAEISDMLLKDEMYINKLISQAFAYHYFKHPKGSSVELIGNNLLISKVILKYIKGVLENDKKHTPFQYLGGEEFCKTKLPTKYGQVNLKGYIDRIDSKDGFIRILDYKTGSGSLEFKIWEDLFRHNQDPKKQAAHVLQTLLYGFLYKNSAQAPIITPGIIYTKQIFNDNFSIQITYKPDKKTKIPIDNYYDYEEDFISMLTTCVEEIFDPSIPFMQTQSAEACSYCDFKTICKK
ncbi:MAG: PD-(D/E)XK nuclease family protein [Paludibacter sp.]|nr:PD-(D/E)XK nuclease family protein [Paludibacter sp.]